MSLFQSSTFHNADTVVVLIVRLAVAPIVPALDRLIPEIGDGSQPLSTYSFSGLRGPRIDDGLRTRHHPLAINLRQRTYFGNLIILTTLLTKHSGEFAPSTQSYGGLKYAIAQSNEFSTSGKRGKQAERQRQIEVRTHRDRG